MVADIVHPEKVFGHCAVQVLLLGLDTAACGSNHLWPELHA